MRQIASLAIAAQLTVVTSTMAQGVVTRSESAHLTLRASESDTVTLKDLRPAPWVVGTSSPAEADPITTFVSRLPIDRVQRMLRATAALRLAELSVGVGLASYSCTKSGQSPRMATAAIQAVRLSTADIFERRGFDVEPEIVPGGMAVYIRTRPAAGR